MSRKNAKSFSNARCFVIAWEANSDRGGMWWTACSGGIKGFLGPVYVSCYTPYLIGFVRSCIGCRLMVFRLGAISPRLHLPGGRTCAMIMARQWTHVLQLGGYFSIEIVIYAVFDDATIRHPKPDFVIVLCDMDGC